MVYCLVGSLFSWIWELSPLFIWKYKDGEIAFYSWWYTDRSFHLLCKGIKIKSEKFNCGWHWEVLSGKCTALSPTCHENEDKDHRWQSLNSKVLTKNSCTTVWVQVGNGNHTVLTRGSLLFRTLWWKSHSVDWGTLLWCTKAEVED